MLLSVLEKCWYNRAPNLVLICMDWYSLLYAAEILPTVIHWKFFILRRAIIRIQHKSPPPRRLTLWSLLDFLTCISPKEKRIYLLLTKGLAVYVNRNKLRGKHPLLWVPLDCWSSLPIKKGTHFLSDWKLAQRNYLDICCVRTNTHYLVVLWKSLRGYLYYMVLNKTICTGGEYVIGATHVLLEAPVDLCLQG